MMVKLSNVVSMVDGLKVIVDKEIDINTSIKLTKIVKSVETEVDLFQKEKDKILKKYGELDESGELVVKDDQLKILDIPAFEKEYQKLLNTEVELDVPKVDVKDLGDIKVSPSTLMKLEPILKEVE